MTQTIIDSNAVAARNALERMRVAEQWRLAVFRMRMGLTQPGLREELIEMDRELRGNIYGREIEVCARIGARLAEIGHEAMQRTRGVAS